MDLIIYSIHINFREYLCALKYYIDNIPITVNNVPVYWYWVLNIKTLGIFSVNDEIIQIENYRNDSHQFEM